MTTHLAKHGILAGIALALIAGLLVGPIPGDADDKASDQPKHVDPGGPGKAPADATVLFDGTDLSGWTHRKGNAAQWEVADGVITCKPGSGDIMSKHKYRSAQIHLEFATPLMPDARSQGRGNSGVYVQGRYEVQVLDSFQNETYANGSCGALYGQYAPLVNACRPPEQWQTYDIVFHAPQCDDAKKVTEPGRLTILLNGVLIQDHVAIKGVCGGELDRNVHEPGPLLLQDHGNKVRYRNIWVRAL
jgi:hypothetical protein